MVNQFFDISQIQYNSYIETKKAEHIVSQHNFSIAEYSYLMTSSQIVIDPNVQSIT